MRSRDEIKRIVTDAFPAGFPKDALVDVSDGYQENIHVIIVSREFDNQSHSDAQDRLWSIVDSTDLTNEEKGLISLLMPISPAQLK